MGWIKRNLFFVIGGAISIALLGGAGFFIYKGWSRNAEASDKLNEIYGNLQTLSQQSPSPGNDKINNTDVAKEQEQQVRAWLNSVQKYFDAIPGIPAAGSVTSESYAAALRRTIDQLQHEADTAGVQLPPRYDFSFSAERSLVQFAPNSLEPLATQLGEVKAIAEILFAARINALDGIQRVRVSDDDAQGPQGDYLDDQAVTNELSIMTPYVVTFRSFTPELARVLANFATVSNTFIVKAINVQPAGAALAASTPEINNGLINGIAPGHIMPGEMPMAGTPGMQAPMAPVSGRGGLQTVLKEQLLRVTLQVELVKLLPKS